MSYPTYRSCGIFCPSISPSATDVRARVEGDLSPASRGGAAKNAPVRVLVLADLTSYTKNRPSGRCAGQVTRGIMPVETAERGQSREQGLA